MIHFEALGAEARQLERETRRAIRCGDLPAGPVCLIVPESVQAYLLAHPGTVLPPLTTIKTHSEIPAAHLRCGGRGIVTRSAGYDQPESVLLELYQSGQIAGLGLDVFTREAEFATLLTGGDVLGEDLTAARALVDMALNRTGNVYVQPHQAFHSDLAHT